MSTALHHQREELCSSTRPFALQKAARSILGDVCIETLVEKAFASGACELNGVKRHRLG